MTKAQCLACDKGNIMKFSQWVFSSCHVSQIQQEANLLQTIRKISYRKLDIQTWCLNLGSVTIDFLPREKPQNLPFLIKLVLKRTMKDCVLLQEIWAEGREDNGKRRNSCYFCLIFNECFVIKNTPLITLKQDKRHSVVARANVMFDREIVVFL